MRPGRGHAGPATPARFERSPEAPVNGRAAEAGFSAFHEAGEAVWQAVRAELQADYAERTFDSWLKPISFEELGEREVVLGLPTQFMCDWVSNHYGERLRQHFAAQLPEIRTVRFIVRQMAPERSVAAVPQGISRVHRPVPGTVALGVPLEERYRFDRFVVGKSNELAYNAARALGEGGKVAFNPLFLHGGTGLGKTHLMHAIGWEVLAQNPTAKVGYMSAEKFMVDFLAALRQKDTISFKQKLRGLDLLMVDDVQFIAGKESTQEEFFHSMNELISAGRRIVITADRSPSDLEGIQERILSRMKWGLVADINAADYELRLNILFAKLQAIEDVKVPDQVIDFLARRITSNVRELEGALNRVIAYARLGREEVTVEFAMHALQDVLRAHDRKVTIDEIQRKVSEYYKVKLTELLSARRARSVARPRQVAMYLAKRYTPRSLPEIGRKFGGRDHTTVMHAVKRIEQLSETDNELRQDIATLSRMIDQ